MAGYLEEKTGGDGNVLSWQTPNRQRLWGLLAAIPAAIFVAHGLYGEKDVKVWEVVVGSILMFGAFLVATWTVKFGLNLKEGSYESVRGFIPALFGERGPAKEVFQCVAVRAETFVEAAKRELEAEEFEQFRVFLVWKQAGREAMLLDTIPDTYEESLDKRDHHAMAIEHAQRIAKPLGLEVLDQARVRAVVTMQEGIEEQVTSNA
ncbi:MAG: hypothetical protein ACKVQS_04485 [Fimbriimonadaceae bacterium]